MADLLPINFHVSDELKSIFPKLPSVCNKQAALFNFHTMTAGWYGEEEKALALNIALLTTEYFVIHFNNVINSKQKHVTYSDDVFTENETEQRQLNVFIAITLAEQSLLITHPHLLFSLLKKKVRKLLNLIAKKHNLAEI